MTARLSYLSFLRDLGVKPTPAQRVTCAIAFDGVARGRCAAQIAISRTQGDSV